MGNQHAMMRRGSRMWWAETEPMPAVIDDAITCNCMGKCDTRRCPCKAKPTKCSLLCHKKQKYDHTNCLNFNENWQSMLLQYMDRHTIWWYNIMWYNIVWYLHLDSNVYHIYCYSDTSYLISSYIETDRYHTTNQIKTIF